MPSAGRKDLEAKRRRLLAATARTRVVTFDRGAAEVRDDVVAAEEPLEIRVTAERDGRRERHRVAVTMRTPGDDFDLAAGFLFTEGVIDREDEIWRIDRCEDAIATEMDNVIEVHLRPEVDFDPERFSRHVYTTSSCGVCGKTSLESVRVSCQAPLRGDWRIDRDRLLRLPESLERDQPVFARTGGLHAAALFDLDGELRLRREDVGRHNAVDKVVGVLFRTGGLPAGERLLLVSGRASFELVQKAVRAGIPALAAVGAPSSLAVELAEEHGMTLVGFLRESRFNVYSGAGRIEA